VSAAWHEAYSHKMLLLALLNGTVRGVLVAMYACKSGTKPTYYSN